jgi:hypothetical protein
MYQQTLEPARRNIFPCDVSGFRRFEDKPSLSSSTLRGEDLYLATDVSEEHIGPTLNSQAVKEE